MGSLYRRGNVWWVKYYRNGKSYRESSQSTKKMVAKKLMDRREGEISKGKLPGVHYEKVTFNQLAEDFLRDYRINQRKSIKRGEGVFGLRRAFTQAGAKSLVMSLWKVPDKETKELMVQFYQNIKSGKMNRCQALRQAILKQKEIVLERYGHDNPRYWGAFVFMGEP